VPGFYASALSPPFLFLLLPHAALYLPALHHLFTYHVGMRSLSLWPTIRVFFL
jgi:hypothetical protein